MKASSTIMMLAVATLLMISCVNGHEMFEHKKLVQGTKVSWTSWFSDQFFLISWIIAALVVYPIGLIATLCGFPEVYASMYDGVVGGWFSLTLYGAK